MKGSLNYSTDSILQGISSADENLKRKSLAKAITLLESSRPEDRNQADGLLSALLPMTGNSLRIGISGAPGVGKSTFIEELGLIAIKNEFRVAVLTIDPSSSISGGSILGDKTRMQKLSTHPNSFVRPSPSSGLLGGVANATRESILLCEAAGFNLIIVETVGVGQSETAVQTMTDMFLLLQFTHAGDDLQAVKKGIAELADMVIVNKADLNWDASQVTVQQWRSVVGQSKALISPTNDLPVWSPIVLPCSAFSEEQLNQIWESVKEFEQIQKANGFLLNKRKLQTTLWFQEHLKLSLLRWFDCNSEIQTELVKQKIAVTNGSSSVPEAVKEVIQLLSVKKNDHH